MSRYCQHGLDPMFCTRCDTETGRLSAPATGSPFARTTGGYIWCDMCGYNATLTEIQFRLLANGHDTWCKDCADEQMDSILCFDRELPDHVIPDEPMPAHQQPDSSRISTK